jgi:hypothetical protein
MNDMVWISVPQYRYKCTGTHTTGSYLYMHIYVYIYEMYIRDIYIKFVLLYRWNFQSLHWFLCLFNSHQTSLIDFHIIVPRVFSPSMHYVSVVIKTTSSLFNALSTFFQFSVHTTQYSSCRCGPLSLLVPTEGEKLEGGWCPQIQCIKLISIWLWVGTFTKLPLPWRNAALEVNYGPEQVYLSVQNSSRGLLARWQRYKIKLESC